MRVIISSSYPFPFWKFEKLLLQVRIFNFTLWANLIPHRSAELRKVIPTEVDKITRGTASRLTLAHRTPKTYWCGVHEVNPEDVQRWTIEQVQGENWAKTDETSPSPPPDRLHGNDPGRLFLLRRAHDVLQGRPGQRYPRGWVHHQRTDQTEALFWCSTFPRQRRTSTDPRATFFKTRN